MATTAVAAASSSRQVRVRAPDVFPSYAVRNVLAQLFSPAVLQVLPYMLPSVPQWLKVALYTLVLININSFPLVWHVRVFGAAILARAKARPSVHILLPFIRSNRYATTMPGVNPRLRLDTLPLGKDIFTDKERTTLRAGPDDCDFNLHMSNSTYPKNLDHVRMRFLAKRFLRLHFDGAHWALGGTSLVFHKEIPFMQTYDIEMTIGAWDDKWLYVVGRFVSPSLSSSKRRNDIARLSRSKSAQNLKRLMSDVVKPQHEAEAKAAKSEHKDVQRQIDQEDKDVNQEKQTLYCTTISRYCIKAGRKTIPPWFVIATSGYGTYASTRTNWDKAEHLRRETLQRVKQTYAEQHSGKPMPRDSLVLGSGYRKAGILAAYDPSRKENEQHESKGLGAWQDRKAWHMAEWEERRTHGLELIDQLGGLAHPDQVQASTLLGNFEQQD